MVLKLNREELSRVIQIITGHGFNLYHQGLQGVVEDDECRFCMEKPEEVQHILFTCQGLDWIRRNSGLSGDHIPSSYTNETKFQNENLLQTPEAVLSLLRFIMNPFMDLLFKPSGID